MFFADRCWRGIPLFFVSGVKWMLLGAVKPFSSVLYCLAVLKTKGVSATLTLEILPSNSFLILSLSKCLISFKYTVHLSSRSKKSLRCHFWSFDLLNYRNFSKIVFYGRLWRLSSSLFLAKNCWTVSLISIFSHYFFNNSLAYGFSSYSCLVFVMTIWYFC